MSHLGLPFRPRLGLTHQAGFGALDRRRHVKHSESLFVGVYDLEARVHGFNSPWCWEARHRHKIKSNKVIDEALRYPATVIPFSIFFFDGPLVFVGAKDRALNRHR